MGSRTAAFGPFVLDRDLRTLQRNGTPIPVGHRGFLLLETLLDASGAPVSKQALMERVWPGATIEEGNLTVQISALRRLLGDGAEAMIVTVPRIGYRLVAPTARRPDGLPMIAVLPFANHGIDAVDGYFADGVAEDIITALSRFRSFAVLSRGASFALRGKGADARSAAAEIGIRYALEGSIRRSNDRLRVTAQLLDAASGTQLWAERYDGAAADVFSFQDRITESVVGVIEPTIRAAEIARSRRKPAVSLDAYDLFLRALPLIHAPSPVRHPEALELLRQSIELDPDFAPPRAYAAWVYEKRISLRHVPVSSEEQRACIELARTAIEIAGDDPLVHGICGFVIFRVAKDVTGLDCLMRAAEASPNSAVIQNLAGAATMMTGDAEASYRFRTRAYELSPGSPDVYQTLHGLGAAEMLRGNDEIAIEWCLKSLATFNDWLFTYITLLTCYVRLGRMEQAAAIMQRVRELSPALTIAAIEEGISPCDDAFGLAVIPALRQAGLPER